MTDGSGLSAKENEQKGLCLHKFSDNSILDATAFLPTRRFNSGQLAAIGFPTAKDGSTLIIEHEGYVEHKPPVIFFQECAKLSWKKLGFKCENKTWQFSWEDSEGLESVGVGRWFQPSQNCNSNFNKQWNATLTEDGTKSTHGLWIRYLDFFEHTPTYRPEWQ